MGPYYLAAIIYRFPFVGECWVSVEAEGWTAIKGIPRGIVTVTHWKPEYSFNGS